MIESEFQNGLFMQEEPGRQEKNHTGSYKADKATDKAQKEGHEADPY